MSLTRSAFTPFAIALMQLACQSVASEVRVEGNWKAAKVVVAYSTQRCDSYDIPDAPARAFRRWDGEAVMFASWRRNRALIGSSLDKLKKECQVVFENTEDSDPRAGSGWMWIASLYTEDGRDIFAIAHNEYHGERHGTCRFQAMNECWNNMLVPLASKDGGLTFDKIAGAKPVAQIPQSYAMAQGRKAGVFHPTNVIRKDRYFYVLAEYRSPNATGTCAYRTSDPWGAGSWSVWNGTDFMDMKGTGANAECRPLTNVSGLLWSIAYVEKARTYIGLMSYRGVKGGRVILGTISSTDLIGWSSPVPVAELPHAWDVRCSDPFIYSYFSMLAPESKARMYDVVGETARVYAMRSRIRDCKYGLDRDLVSWDVQVAH